MFVRSTGQVADPVKLFEACRLAHARVKCTWKPLLERRPDVLRRQWACQCKPVEAPDPPVACACTAFDSLTLQQRQNCMEYERQHAAKFSRKHGIFHLGDNPLQRLVWSNGPHGGCPTLRTSMGKLWLQSQRRWLLKSELLQGMGWDPATTPGRLRAR